MLLLASTSDIIRIVTGSAASINVNATWVDDASGTITPGRTDTAAITTATTTTVVASPGASTQRNAKFLSITNNHATASTQVTVQHFDGTNSADLASVTLLSGENLTFGEGTFTHHDFQSAPYAYSPKLSGNLGITGTISESLSRALVDEVAVGGSSGLLIHQGVWLNAGDLVSNISFHSSTVAAGTPTNWFFALYGSNRQLLAQSANQTTTAWAANTLMTLAMATAYRVQVSGIYYASLMITATTVPNLKGKTAETGGQLQAYPFVTGGSSTSALTTTLPNPCAAMVNGLSTIWAAVT